MALSLWNSLWRSINPLGSIQGARFSSQAPIAPTQTWEDYMNQLKKTGEEFAGRLPSSPTASMPPPSFDFSWLSNTAKTSSDSFNRGLLPSLQWQENKPSASEDDLLIPKANASEWLNEQLVSDFVKQWKARWMSDDDIESSFKKAYDAGEFSLPNQTTQEVPKEQPKQESAPDVWFLQWAQNKFNEISDKFWAPVIELWQQTAKGIDSLIDYAMWRQADPSNEFHPEDVAKIGNAAIWATFNAVAPIVTLALNTVSSTPWLHYATDALWAIVETWGNLVNKIPGLSDFKESLPTEEDKKAFDTFVWSLWVIWTTSAVWKMKGMTASDIVDKYNSLPWVVVWKLKPTAPEVKAQDIYSNIAKPPKWVKSWKVIKEEIDKWFEGAKEVARQNPWMDTSVKNVAEVAIPETLQKLYKDYTQKAKTLASTQDVPTAMSSAIDNAVQKYYETYKHMPPDKVIEDFESRYAGEWKDMMSVQNSLQVDARWIRDSAWQLKPAESQFNIDVIKNIQDTANEMLWEAYGKDKWTYWKVLKFRDQTLPIYLKDLKGIDDHMLDRMISMWYGAEVAAHVINPTAWAIYWAFKWAKAIHSYLSNPVRKFWNMMDYLDKANSAHKPIDIQKLMNDLPENPGKSWWWKPSNIEWMRPDAWLWETALQRSYPQLPPWSSEWRSWTPIQMWYWKVEPKQEKTFPRPWTYKWNFEVSKQKLLSLPKTPEWTSYPRTDEAIESIRRESLKREKKPFLQLSPPKTPKWTSVPKTDILSESYRPLKIGSKKK